MRTHTIGFKNAIKQFGREIDAKVTYTLNNNQTILGGEELNSISYHYEGDILKSVMKQLDIDSNVDIPLNTLVNLKFGVKVSNAYEYLDYGNFVVYKSEKQEDTSSYKITCYDKMLYSMIDYANMNITYPITIKNYISAICSYLGLTFANSSDTFTNYDKEIPSELYLDSQGETLGYTFRDVLDELAEVTASIICINDDDELEVRYFKNIDINLINMPDSTITMIGGTLTTNTNGNNVTYNGTYSYPGSSSYMNLNNNHNNYIDIPKGDYLLYSNNIADKARFGVTFFDQNNQVIVGKGITYDNKSVEISLPRDASRLYTQLGVAYGDGIVATFDNVTFQVYLVSKDIDIINEEYLKDINVNFGEQYGPINTITFTRSGGTDSISLSEPSNLEDNLKRAIVIEDNQILNDDNRSDYLAPILNRLYGLNYYLNDLSSTGIGYFELGDKYGVEIENKVYNCIMLNDEINITQGLEELIHTDISEQAETDYTKATKTDKLINKTSLIVDKVNQEISGIISRVENLQVGGTNLIKNSGNFNFHIGINDYFDFSTEVVNESSALSGKALKVTCISTAGTNGGFWFGAYNYNPEYEGKEMTLSFYIKSSRAISDFEAGSENNGIKTINLTTDWIRFTNTFTYHINPNGYQAIIFYASNSNPFQVGDIIHIKDLKFEEGTMATTWDMNPDDTPIKSEVTNEITQKINDNNSAYVNVELAKKVNGTDVTKAYLMLKLTNNRSDATLGADEINLSATDVINLLAGGTINLTSKNIIITSDNYSVDANGHATMYGATINGKIKASEFTGNAENVKLRIGSDSDGYASTDNTLEFKSSDDFLILSIFNKRFANNTQITYFKTNSNNGYYFIGKLKGNNDIEADGKILGSNLDCGDGYANFSNWTTINFHQTFPSTPHVTATPDTNESGIIALKIRNISTTGFEVIVGGSGSATIYFRWIAMSK